MGESRHLVLIRLMTMSFSGTFSHHHSNYTRPTGGFGVFLIGGYRFLILIRLVDLGFSEVF